MIKIPRAWETPERDVTPEKIYFNRREFLHKLGQVGLGAWAISTVLPFFSFGKVWAQDENSKQLEASPERIVTGYNNYYEFGNNGSSISQLALNLNTEGWTVRIGGLVKKPRTLDLSLLLRQISKEDRVYKLRCVETWTITVPWTGFPLKKLVRILDPLSSARYIVFKTFIDPNIALGQKKRFWEPWPYVEGLRLDEAQNDLSFMATGLYGKPLTPQNGAPVRLVVPWKYGFKSIKAIAEIEFTKDPPTTFWQAVSPLEYDFWANVNPNRSYARWNQSVEYELGKGSQVRTQPFNGFASQVANLYI